MDARRAIRPEAAKAHGQAGLYAPQLLGPVVPAALTLTAGRCYLMRFQADWARTIIGLAYVVDTAAGANDAVDVGILDAAYLPLASAGSTSGKLNATGVQSVSLSAAYTLEAGRIYYAALAGVTPFGGTAAKLAGFSGSTASVGDLFGTAAGIREMAAQTPKFPISTTALAPVATVGVPLVALRES